MERSFPRQYELRDAERVTGVPWERIKNWAAQGVIAPTGGPTGTSGRPGTGGRRFFTADDLIAIGLVDGCRAIFGDWIRPRIIAQRIQEAVRAARIGDWANPPANLVVLLHAVPRGAGKGWNVAATIMPLDEVGSRIDRLTRSYRRVPVYTILGLGAVLAQIRRKG